MATYYQNRLARAKERLTALMPPLLHQNPTTAREVLENLLHVLREGKWAQGAQIRPATGAVCLIGGLRYATLDGDGIERATLSTGLSNRFVSGSFPEPRPRSDLGRAYRKAERALVRAIHQKRGNSYTGIIGYNDSHARSKKDIIEVVQMALNAQS